MFETLWENEICINRMKGVTSFTAVLEYVRENVHIWEQSPLLWDLSKCTFDKNADESKEIQSILTSMQNFAQMRTGQKTAFVASSDYEFGMLRIFAAFMEIQQYPFQSEVFRTYGRAISWLKADDF